MKARDKDIEIATRIARYTGKPEHQPTGADWSALVDAAGVIRRAGLVAHRWAEEECNGTIQRDDDTGKPYRYSLNHHGEPATCSRFPLPDREAQAIARARRAAESIGLGLFHQTDPRGAPFYVGRPEDIQPHNYTRGVCIA